MRKKYSIVAKQTSESSIFSHDFLMVPTIPHIRAPLLLEAERSFPMLSAVSSASQRDPAKMRLISEEAEFENSTAVLQDFAPISEYSGLVSIV